MHLEILWENGDRNTVSGSQNLLWELTHQLDEDDRVDSWEMHDVQ